MGPRLALCGPCLVNVAVSCDRWPVSCNVWPVSSNVASCLVTRGPRGAGGSYSGLSSFGPRVCVDW